MTNGGAACTTCGAPLADGQQFCTQCGATAVRRDLLRDRLQALLGAELEVLDVVGRGGMAVVYVARDPLLERKVAVKAMLPEFATDAEMADRFLREARTAAQLQHPNIVSVFGARSRGDLLVMLMAFVEGRSLDAVLQEQGPLPLHIVGRLAADMASALQYAHEHKVIHRDVKPANVLLASNGGALVSDFGIARRQDVPGLTGEGMLLGSLAYMSPEQRSAEVLTGATDQYALGVSVFEMLAGRGPFLGSPIEVHLAHLQERPPSVREFRADVPDAVAHAIHRMLAKTPAERFPDLREPRRIFERLVTDARSASAAIARLSGVLVTPTASRVISAARRAPTVPIVVSTAPPAAVTVAVPAASAATVAAPAPAGPPATPTVRMPAAQGGRGLIYAAVGVAVVILGGAVMLKSRQSATALRPPVATAPAGSAPATAPASAGDGRTQAAPVRERSASAAPGAAPVDTAPIVSGQGAAAPAGVLLPTAKLSTRPQEPAPAAAAAPVAAEPAAAASPTPAAPPAVLADARAGARALVTLMNQHRARDIERLADAGGGDAVARRALERMVRESGEFGFDAMATEPEMDGAAFLTEFVVDATWRSGGRDQRALFEIRLRMVRQGDAWVASAFSVKAR